MRIDGSRGDQTGSRHETVVVDDENHAGQQEREREASNDS